MNYNLALRFFAFIVLVPCVISCSDQSANNTIQNEPAIGVSHMDENGDKKAPIPMNQALYLTPDTVQELELKAEGGDGAAALKLYGYYGLYVFDNEKEMYWLRKSAENGNAHAQRNLGVRILENRKYGSREDGLRWLEKAADAGDLNAKIELGQKFSEEEIEKLEREADSGNSVSADTLYLYFKNVEKDDKRAQHWYDRWDELQKR